MLGARANPPRAPPLRKGRLIGRPQPTCGGNVDDLFPARSVPDPRRPRSSVRAPSLRQLNGPGHIPIVGFERSVGRQLYHFSISGFVRLSEAVTG